MDEKTKLIIALSTILAVLVIIYFLMPYNIKVVHIINKTYVSQVNNTFVYNSIPIKITQNSLFGNTSNNIKEPICNDLTYAFYLQNKSNMYVLYDNVYIPTYIILEGNYYKANLTARGLNFTGNDYIPSLIGKSIFLVGLGKTNPFVNQLIYPTYIVKTETIQGNAVFWNLTYDGNISNAINIKLVPYNKTASFTEFLFGNNSGTISSNKNFNLATNQC